MNPFKTFKNGIAIAPSYSVDPITGKRGDIYYNSATNRLRLCTSASPTVVWTTLGLLPGQLDGNPLVWNASTSNWEAASNVIILGNDFRVVQDSALNITAGDTTTVNGDGYNLNLSSGLGNGTGDRGKIALFATTLLINAFKTADPSYGQSAEVYYNTTLKQFRYNDGSTWRALGAGTGLAKVTLRDPISTILPTTPPVSIDGHVLVDGDTVLFSNLISGSNKVYKISGASTTPAWTPQVLFDGSDTPTEGDTVIITSGLSFHGAVGTFTSAKWSFSERRRQYNGTDYYEESTVYASTIHDNSTDSLFSINASGSEYIIVDYSIKRGTAREVGTLYIVQDGTSATVTGANGSLSPTGIIFDVAISAGVLTLSSISDSAGTGGTFKFIIRRWSDAVGGPEGVPSYSGAPVVTAPAAGGAGQIQFSDGANLAASSNFKINTTDNAFELGGHQLLPLSAPVTLNDNQPSASTIFSYSSIWEFVEIEYSIERGTNRSRGRLLVTTNGTDVNITDDYVELDPRQVMFSASLSGGSVNIEYISSSTGAAPIFRYSQSRWQ